MHKLFMLGPIAGPMMVFAPDGGDGGGGSFFKADDGGDGGDGGNGGDGGGGGEGGERPDWLIGKFDVTGEDGSLDLTASAQKQAEGYSDLYRRFSKKTDNLRAEVLDQAVKDYGKTIGVPEDLADYTYGEGFQAPNEDVDKSLREWAQKNNVNNDAFQELISGVWGQLQPNHDKEYEALGPDADKRVDAVNKWANANIGKDHHPQVAKIMQTADGVAFIEGMVEKFSETGFMNDNDDNSGGDQLTRASIREMQGDPRYGTDEAFTAKVTALWQKYAALPEHKRK